MSIELVNRMANPPTPTWKIFAFSFFKIEHHCSGLEGPHSEYCKDDRAWNSVNWGVSNEAFFGQSSAVSVKHYFEDVSKLVGQLLLYFHRITRWTFSIFQWSTVECMQMQWRILLKQNKWFSSLINAIYPEGRNTWKHSPRSIIVPQHKIKGPLNTTECWMSSVFVGM